MNLRNKPCPCNSGRKFKRCCGSEAAINEKRRKEHEAFVAGVKAREEERRSERERDRISDARFRRPPMFVYTLAAALFAGSVDHRRP